MQESDTYLAILDEGAEKTRTKNPVASGQNSLWYSQRDSDRNGDGHC